MRTALIEIILKKDLVTVEGQQNKVTYQGIEFGASLLIGDHDVDQPNILVTLDYIETCYLGI